MASTFVFFNASISKVLADTGKICSTCIYCTCITTLIIWDWFIAVLGLNLILTSMQWMLVVKFTVWFMFHGLFACVLSVCSLSNAYMVCWLASLLQFCGVLMHNNPTHRSLCVTRSKCK